MTVCVYCGENQNNRDHVDRCRTAIRDRLEEAEAQAAAMRALLKRFLGDRCSMCLRTPTEEPKRGCPCERIRHALSSDAGKVLLERLRAAEAVAAASSRYCADEPPCNCGEMAPGPCCTSCRNEREIRDALRAWEKAKKR